jgi:hypothetical protein
MESPVERARQFDGSAFRTTGPKVPRDFGDRQIERRL